MMAGVQSAGLSHSPTTRALCLRFPHDPSLLRIAKLGGFGRDWLRMGFSFDEQYSCCTPSPALSSLRLVFAWGVRTTSDLS
jgi:hypothetical protein